MEINSATMDNNLKKNQSISNPMSQEGHSFVHIHVNT